MARAGDAHGFNRKCEIHLCRVNNQIVIRTETENLNSKGFYCTCDQPFSPGERFECELLIPVERAGVGCTSLMLRRHARVVRVEIRGLEPGFGITCQFEESAADGAGLGSSH